MRNFAGLLRRWLVPMDRTSGLGGVFEEENIVNALVRTVRLTSPASGNSN